MRSETNHFIGCRRNTGSALIIALIFTTILGVVSVPSYLRLCNQTYKDSNRAFYSMVTINLAESGVEYAVNAIMSANGTSGYNWSDWTIQGDDAQIQLDDHIFIGNITGTTNIYIYNYAGTSPEVVAKATVVLPVGPVINKYMYASISASSSKGLFAYGVLTKDFINAAAGGGVIFDSWDSDPDNDPSTFLPYSRGVATDKIAVATTGTTHGAFNAHQSKIYGTAAIGATDYSALTATWGSWVGPKDKDEWDPSDYEKPWLKNGWNVSTQTGALATNFTAEFEDIASPNLNLTHLWTEYKLSYNADIVRPNGTIAKNAYIDKETIGQAGVATNLELNDLQIDANGTLTIAGDVTIVFPKEDTLTLKVIAGGAIKFEPDATLTIYTAGDVEISGAGLFNQIAPERLQIWGTSNNTQNFDFKGSAHFSGIIYAPNAKIKATGAAALYGAFISQDLTLQGSGAIHYDQSLANYTGGTSSAGPTRVDYVEELVGDERDAYLANLAF